MPPEPSVRPSTPSSAPSSILRLREKVRALRSVQRTPALRETFVKPKARPTPSLVTPVRPTSSSLRSLHHQVLPTPEGKAYSSLPPSLTGRPRPSFLPVRLDERSSASCQTSPYPPTKIPPTVLPSSFHPPPVASHSRSVAVPSADRGITSSQVIRATPTLTAHQSSLAVAGGAVATSLPCV